VRSGKRFRQIRIFCCEFLWNVSKPSRSVEQLRARGKTFLGGSLSVRMRSRSHRSRLEAILYDEAAVRIWMLQHVPLVGHSHPRVVEAAQKQLALPHKYALSARKCSSLCGTSHRTSARTVEGLPFRQFGSEANELAIRMAPRRRLGRHYRSGARLPWAHQHADRRQSYKFEGPRAAGSRGTRCADADDYRGFYRRGEKISANDTLRMLAKLWKRCARRGAAQRISRNFNRVLRDKLFSRRTISPKSIAAFARPASLHCRRSASGVRRLGTHFWGFETQAVVPDIVVFGKRLEMRSRLPQS